MPLLSQRVSSFFISTAVGLLLSCSASAIVPPQNHTLFSVAQQAEIERIIINTLKKHPEMIRGAIKTDHVAQNRSPIDLHKNELFRDPSSPAIGNLNGEATVVEFFDYQCGHCKTMRLVLETLLQQNSNVKVVMKELPIFGDQSVYAAKAALAAKHQGKYWVFHQALLTKEGGIPNEEVITIARRVGIDINQLKRDMQDPSIDAQLKKNDRLATALNVEGTPTLFLSNKSMSRFEVIPGSVSVTNLQRSIGEVIVGR